VNNGSSQQHQLKYLLPSARGKNGSSQEHSPHIKIGKVENRDRNVQQIIIFQWFRTRLPSPIIFLLVLIKISKGIDMTQNITRPTIYLHYSI
jgi:hypothetical protein